MVVGIAKLALYLPGCHSLKEKRRVLRKLKDQALNRFKVQIAEIDRLDVWQSAGIGFSLVGNDRRVIQSLIDRVLNFVEQSREVQIVDRTSEIVNY